MEENEIEVPIFGVNEDKIDAFKDLMIRYLVDNDAYNLLAVANVYRAMIAIQADKPIMDVLKAMDPVITGFQLNWIMRVLGEYSIKGEEITELWAKYQKSLEPKKRHTRRYKESPLEDD
jgi:hypothetical protein